MVFPYHPVLPDEQVVHVDTTDLNAVDIADVTARVRVAAG
jgi:hypothetical protein